VICQSIDKRLIHPSYLSEALLGIRSKPQLEPNLRESSAHLLKISR